MNFYAVRFGLNSPISQSQLMDTLKSSGAEVIQTSDGLCVKSAKSETDIRAAVGTTVGVSLSKLDKRAACADPATPQDIKTFLES